MSETCHLCFQVALGISTAMMDTEEATLVGVVWTGGAINNSNPPDTPFNPHSTQVHGLIWPSLLNGNHMLARLNNHV